jgi:hypothetical protein
VGASRARQPAAEGPVLSEGLGGASGLPEASGNTNES